MRVPDDKSLESYIRELIKEDKVEQFYQTDDWKELREKVLEDNHYECGKCIEKGKYARAECVHHVNEVRVKPDLALSKYYVDKEGNKLLNLIPLCNTCHNIIHDKLGNWQRKDKFFNEEKW